MRPLNTSTIFYVPEQVPSDPAQLPMYLENEFAKIKRSIEQISMGHFEVTYVEPPKPRKGDLRYADGVSWNPGSGQGVYVYKGTTWVLLG